MPPTVGESLTAHAVSQFRARLASLPTATPEQIETLTAQYQQEHASSHCRICGTFLVERAAGGTFACVRCAAPKRPWPKSRQGYSPPPTRR